jgi:hypothetical protein
MSLTPSLRSKIATLSLLSALLFFTPHALAQGGPIEMDDSSPAIMTPPAKVKSNGPPVVGRRAAEKYMIPRDDSTPARDREPGQQLSASDHYLALHIGEFVSDNAYRWGSADNQSDVGDAVVGVTYRMGEWQNSMDFALRLDYNAFGLADGTAGKLSFLPMITFPDASSKFPLYLGAGVGVGIFTKQIDKESALALDYQLVLGARFFEVFANTGFFIEAGLKNSLFLLTDGQFNGTFVAVGPVFTF